jgi:hydrogenase maturation protease
MTETPSVVVLGVGNTLMQDDGVGVWAVRALAECYHFPANVRLIEAGTAGLHLLSEIEGADHLLIIDAVIGKERPGSIYRLAPDDLPKRQALLISAHEIGINEVLSTAKLLGKTPHTRILGVQPLEADRPGFELTPTLKRAFPFVIAAAVEELKAMGVEVQTINLRASAGHA